MKRKVSDKGVRINNAQYDNMIVRGMVNEDIIVQQEQMDYIAYTVNGDCLGQLFLASAVSDPKEVPEIKEIPTASPDETIEAADQDEEEETILGKIKTDDLIRELIMRKGITKYRAEGCGYSLKVNGKRSRGNAATILIIQK